VADMRIISYNFDILHFDKQESFITKKWTTGYYKNQLNTTIIALYKKNMRKWQWNEH